MPRYFTKFPKLLYSKGGNSTLATNLLARIDTIKSSLENKSIFYTYNVQEGDTPEIVASKYYEDPELHWVVMLFNDVYDPFYDWPMTYQQFETFIADKYGSAATAKVTNHHYEKIVETTDTFSGETTKNVYIIDLTTYNSLPVKTDVTRTFTNGQSVRVVQTKRDVDCYTYEDELNESKRNIKLIRNDLIPEVRKQFETLMGV